jgi:hypothetical protein
VRRRPRGWRGVGERLETRRVFARGAGRATEAAVGAAGAQRVVWTGLTAKANEPLTQAYDLDYLWIAAAVLFAYALLAAACRVRAFAEGGTSTTLLAAGSAPERVGLPLALPAGCICRRRKRPIVGHDTRRDRCVLREAGQCVGAS